jgi:DNA processing protein
MNDELFFRLALNLIPGLTNGTIKKLIQKFGSAENIFNQEFKTLQLNFKFKIPKVELNAGIESEVKKELLHIQKNGIQVAYFDQSEYPKRIAVCKSFPNLFFYMGEPLFNQEKVLSIVGTREATEYGADVVQKIVSEIAPANPLIVSGLALGIDTLAHEAALKNNLKTIGILGSGLGRIYPSSNQKLTHKMVQSGSTVLSEFFYSTNPDKTNFPKRNRIIASLSDATLVVETKSKGGSIITAKMAHAYNRDLFSIPGSIFESGQMGCNDLIQSGMAKLITSGQDILDTMYWNDTTREVIQPTLFNDFTENEELIFRIIQQKGKSSIDEIISLCSKNTPSQVVAILLNLEFQGYIECIPGKIYRIIRR